MSDKRIALVNQVPCPSCDGLGHHNVHSAYDGEHHSVGALTPCVNCKSTGKVDPDAPLVNQQGVIVHEVGLTVNGERVDIHLRHLQWHVHLGQRVLLVTMSHDGKLFVTPDNDVPLGPEDLFTVRRGVAADLSACLSMVNLRYSLDAWEKTT